MLDDEPAAINEILVLFDIHSSLHNSLTRSSMPSRLHTSTGGGLHHASQTMISPPMA